LPAGSGALFSQVIMADDPASSPGRMDASTSPASAGALSAGLAHEVRNALVAVRTLMDLLKEGRAPGDLLELADQELRRADALIGQILRLGSLEKPVYGRVRVNELVEHTARLIAHRAEREGVQVILDLHRSVGTVEGNMHQLQQVLLNLCFNALDAMRGGGELRLRTQLIPAEGEPDALRVQVTVEDTGVGIPPAIQQRIFDPFFTTKEHGTGLGLAVSRRILEEHGAAIEVGSNQGRGTTFFIRFGSGRAAVGSPPSPPPGA
jgi:signal transduction histidine kinase